MRRVILLLVLLAWGFSSHAASKGQNKNSESEKGHGHHKDHHPPTAPNHLEASGVSPFEIDLSWSDASEGEDGFKIERSTDGKKFNQIAQVLPNTTSYRNTGLFPSTKYYYRVRSYRSARHSTISNEAHAQTQTPECALSVNDWGGPFGGPAPRGLVNAVALSTAGLHSLALKADGTVVGWGYDLYGQATPPATLTGAVAVAAGGFHSLGLRADGTVVGWGDDSFGQATPPPGLKGVVAIAAGYFYSLGLKSDGTVVGWGDNSYGQATPPENLTGVVAIAAGAFHSLALRSDGTVIGWGFDFYGQATPPAGLTDAVAIIAGVLHSLALKRDGTVIGWGDNSNGETTIPTNLNQVVAIAAGYDDSLAIKGDTSVVGWGLGYNGEMVPSDFTGLVAIAAGGYYGLALTTTPEPAPQLLAKVDSANQIQLSWRDNSGGKTRLTIERAPDYFGNPETWTEIAALSPGATNYNDTSVTTNTAYWYRARAHNACGGSRYGYLAYVTVGPPVVPSPFTATVGSANRVNLSWTEWPGGAAGFTIQRANDNGGAPGAWADIATVTPANASDTAFTDSTVTTNVTYWYRILAFNSLGVSPYSDPVSVSLLSPAAPSLRAEPLSDRVQLSWGGDFPPSTLFKLERAPDLAGQPGAWLEIATLSRSNSFDYLYLDRGLASGATYWYRARASNWLGQSPYSDPVSATIGPPAAPGYLVATIGTSNRVDLSWAGAGDQDGFKIERALDDDGSPGAWLEIATTGGPVFLDGRYADSDVITNTGYWYRVRAYNKIGLSPYSDPARVSVAPPQAPSDLHVTAFDGTATLSWTDNSEGVRGFRIERALDDDGSPGTWTRIAFASDTAYHEEGLSANTYWYRVQAYNWAGDSPYADPVAVIVAIPAVPSILFTRLGSSNQVELWWHESSGDADGFEIQRANDVAGSPGIWGTIATIGTSNGVNRVFGYTDAGVTNNLTYWYRLLAFNTVGDSPYSAAVSVTIPAPTAPSNPAVSSLQAPRITSVSRTNNDVLIIWSTARGTTNVVEAALSPSGIFSDLSPNIFVFGTGNTVTNYLDAGALSNAPARFYRIRLAP